MTEEPCDRCGGPNLWSWSAPSDRFNVAVAAIGLTSGAIICPVCFVDGHEIATGLRTNWTLDPREPFHHIGSIEGEPPAAVHDVESDLLSVLTDEAKAASCSTEKLVGELVKRGKLHREKAPAYMVAANMSDETWLERAVTDWEPVGSGDLFDVIRFVGPP